MAFESEAFPFFIHCDVLVTGIDPAISLRVISDELVMRSRRSGYPLLSSSLSLFTPLGTISFQRWLGSYASRSHCASSWLLRGALLLLLSAMTWDQRPPYFQLLRDLFNNFWNTIILLRAQWRWLHTVQNFIPKVSWPQKQFVIQQEKLIPGRLAQHYLLPGGIPLEFRQRSAILRVSWLSSVPSGKYRHST